MEKQNTHGGKRAGAGRPRNMEKSLVLAEHAVAALKEAAQVGLISLGAKFLNLVEEEIITALDPETPTALRQKSRQFLITLYLNAVPPQTKADEKLKELIQSLSAGKAQTQNLIQGDVYVLAGDRKPDIIEAEYKSLPGTAGDVPRPGQD